jgi:hypothetical protein
MNSNIKGPKKKEDVEPLMDIFRQEYREWKEQNRKTSKGFFLIYNTFVNDGILKNISGNALKLYIYLCTFSRNDTGESWHSVEKISEYFEVDKRSIKRWFAELEEKRLIIRIQKGYKRVANTFLRPYDIDSLPPNG